MFETLQDEWMRDATILMTVWFTVVLLAGTALIAFGDTIAGL